MGSETEVCGGGGGSWGRRLKGKHKVASIFILKDVVTRHAKHTWPKIKEYGEFPGSSVSTYYSRLRLFSLPDGSDGKESACSVGDRGLIPESERSPGEGNGHPLQYSCLENSRGRGAWWMAWGRRVRQDWVINTFTFSLVRSLLQGTKIPQATVWPKGTCILFKFTKITKKKLNIIIVILL